MLALLIMILSKSCEPDEILEDGLICCNKDKSMKSNEKWSCDINWHKYYYFKIFPSIIFTIIGFIVHFLHRKIVGNRWKDFLYLFIRSLTEFILNSYFYIISLYSICHQNPSSILIAFSISILLFPFNILFSFLPFAKNNMVYSVYLLPYRIKFAKNFIDSLLNIFIFIFSYTGYFMVFDAFAFALSVRYRNVYDDMYEDILYYIKFKITYWI